ncbi:SecDF P1 head subdomain-containing protein [Mesorhizobium sp. B1-1-8]|uniref:SecDF P1 head subdomain-containing protein n=1 Tax=Mesorhizobium sp. B1-1-8 TaxID=2589976 RepID=UPI00112D9AD4|nr:hypothetical protein [Mesorhizobium sp. B1-1-8]UCI05107.1 hypothetical protein FJ974_14645 [Mesorhizobium sp. B1-1-8]
MRFSRLTKILIGLAVAVVIIFGLLIGARSIKPDGPFDDLLAWVPKRQTRFERQGGSQFLLEVDKNDLIESRLETVLEDVRSLLRNAKIGYRGLFVSDREFRVHISDPAEIDAAKTALKIFTDPIAGDNPIREFVLDEPEPGLLRLTLTGEGMKLRNSMAMVPSMETVRLRASESDSEPIVQQQGDDRILLQVPGLRDPQRLKEILGRSGRLTFQMIDTSWPIEDALKNRPPRGSSVLFSQDEPPVPYLVEDRVIVSGDNIVDARATYNAAMDAPVVSFRFDAKGTARFGEATSQNVGKPFAMILDNQVLSAPIIREPILGGSGQISGNFTKESADDLALILRSGPMAASLKIVEVRTIAPGGVQN